MSVSEKRSDLKVDHNIDNNDDEIEQSFQVPLNGKETKRHLLPRHIQLIAISGAIGTGLFVSASEHSDIRHGLITLDWHWLCAAQGRAPRTTSRLHYLWRSRLHRLQLNGGDGVIPTY